MSKYGRVFKVFDDQDSGNICFGTEKDGQRYFIKFAGAPTEQYNRRRPRMLYSQTANRLLPVYQRSAPRESDPSWWKPEILAADLRMVFQWADGDCMGRMYPAAHHRFMQLPVNTRRNVFRDILSFFEYLASRHYVAIDFYDGSILYDFENGKTTICDIDFFRKQPCVNDRGRMWGSSHFQAPGGIPPGQRHR